MKSLRNLVSRRANKAMLDQETDNAKTSNQIDISIASSSKQEKKAKKQNQGLKTYPNRTRRDKRGRNTGGARGNYWAK